MILKAEWIKKADRLGELNDLVKDATKELDALKTEFKNEGKDHVTGIRFVVNLVKGKTTSLDRALMVKELGEEALSRYSKTTEYLSVRVSAA